MMLLHRNSFVHRNPRTYLVVVYKPEEPICQSVEQEIEALAQAVATERRVAVLKFNVNDPQASEFAWRLLELRDLPAVLLYPEGVAGYAKLLDPSHLTAQRLLAAIKHCYQRTLPHALPLNISTQPISKSTPDQQHVFGDNGRNNVATPVMQSIVESSSLQASLTTGRIASSKKDVVTQVKPTVQSTFRPGSGLMSNSRLWVWSLLLGGGMLLYLVQLLLEPWVLSQAKLQESGGQRNPKKQQGAVRLIAIDKSILPELGALDKKSMPVEKSIGPEDKDIERT